MGTFDSRRAKHRGGRFDLRHLSHGTALGAAIVLAACAKSPAPPAEAPFAARLDSAVAEAVRNRELPGAALVVVQGDRITYSKGFGHADLAAGRPYTDSSHTVIGSTSKPVTALAVLRLVQLGQVALDTPIVRYVPDLAFKDARGRAITLRHLLTNRSGLRVGFSGPAFERPSRVGPGEVEGLARRMAEMPLLFAPGEGYAYSNRGWALAGYVVQRVSGTPIEDFLRTEVFEPLGMTETTLEFWKVTDLVQGYREGRQPRNVPAPASLSQEYGPSGMIVSTPRDMGRLLVAMLNRGKTVLGTQFLTPELIDEALRGQAEAESELGGPTRYALGWEVDSTFGDLTIKKAGSVSTMVSLWVMLPSRKLGLAFAFNREDYQVVPLVGNVLAILAGGEAKPFTSTPAPPPVAPAAVPIAPAVRDRWVGDYDTRYGDLRIFVRDDSLLAHTEGMDIPLAAIDDSTFALVTDLVSETGQAFQFRRRGPAVTVWSGRDSLGIRLRP